MKHIQFFVILVLIPVSLSIASAEQQLNLDGQGVALHGYDPVSYFMGDPEKGSEDLKFEYQGARYQFSSQKNMEAFVSNPWQYQFGYGGWCAWAMLEGQKVDVDPERFKIIDGVVYLFYNTFFTDTLKKWNTLAQQKNEVDLIRQADEHWQQMGSS